MDERYYLSVASEMQAKLRRLSAFVSHGPSIGSYHEEVLKSVISPLVPGRFTLRTGFCFSRELGPSLQGDIIVVDENCPTAYFFREGAFAVLDPAAVVAVIEVKTRLGPKTFREAMTTLRSFSVMTEPRWLPTFLFAFECPPLTEKRLDGWYRSVALPDERASYPAAIMALNRGLLRLKILPGNCYGHALIAEKGGSGPKAACFSVFLQTLRKAMQMRSGDTSNPFEYALLDGLVETHEQLVVGRGVVGPAV